MDTIGHGHQWPQVADSATSSEDRGYAYDAAWNLSHRTNSTGTDTFTVNNRNELTYDTIGGYSYTDTYDNNGNLTQHNYGIGDDTHLFAYDGENRLKEATYYYLAGLTDKIIFQYDGLGRLRIRTTCNVASGTTNVIRYIYDGWRVIQERDNSNTPTVSYTRGSDLSGTMEGAGGIGGLLARSHGYSSGDWSTHNFYHADGNGNVTYLVDGSQASAASYRYDPYGNLISSNGSLASANVYRFSSKEWVAFESGYPYAVPGLYYYGYRFYAPALQRWLNRDPIGEVGWINLHAFAHNSPVSMVDTDGRFTLVLPIGGIILIGGGLMICYAVPSCREAITRPWDISVTAPRVMCQSKDDYIDAEEDCAEQWKDKWQEYIYDDPPKIVPPDLLEEMYTSFMEDCMKQKGHQWKHGKQ